MTASRTFRVLAMGVILVGVSHGPSFATCQGFPGFPIFQCANEAHFASAPFSITLDPNGRPTNVTTVFWQIGFGNKTVSTGSGFNGTGMASSSNFNGNDSGLVPMDLVDFLAGTGESSPANALCLRSHNWQQTGIDGCCDDQRDPSLVYTSDAILNPLYDVYHRRAYGPDYAGLFSNVWVQDYPMAVLLKDTGGSFFAFAAVASMQRANNTGGDGDCAVYPHTGNLATCDARSGFFDFSDVSNGQTNPIVSGKNNVVPWQSTPVPQSTLISCANPGVSPSQLNVSLTWNGVETYSDQSSIPSGNSTLAPQDSTRSPGVGVNDIISKFSGLVRYRIDKAPSPSFLPVTPVNEFFENPTRVPASPDPTQAATLGEGECARVTTIFGKKQETSSYSVVTCRTGRCGDVGYEVASGWVCFGTDPDGDRVDNAVCADNCLNDYNPDQLDSDIDLVGDVCDDCAADATNMCDPL